MSLRLEQCVVFNKEFMVSTHSLSVHGSTSTLAREISMFVYSLLTPFTVKHFLGDIPNTVNVVIQAI